MSQWNEGNSYNSRQNRGENWSNNQDGQYSSQGSQNQQGSNAFNQFVSQMQGNGASRSNHNDQYTYYGQQHSNGASTSNNYSNDQGRNSRYMENHAGPSDANRYNDAIFRSNLTPTATEFVPKNMQSYNTKQESVPPSETVNGHELGYYRSRRSNSTRDDYSRRYDNSGNRKITREPDGRTFYNTKSSQDVRNTFNNRNRNNYSSPSQRVTWDRNDDINEAQLHELSRETEFTQKLNKRKSFEREMTQRERLSEQLEKGTLECLVCCEQLKQTESVWSCNNCFNVQHLRCIKKWATSSIQEGKWRCPACQNTSVVIPSEYRCMCGAVRNPVYMRGSSGAHTCGHTCSRPRSCPHPCTLLCHPGPCPPCQATVRKTCSCGAESRTITCSNKQPQVCNRTCNKPLNCGLHTCSETCHEGSCDTCKEIIKQVCYCPGSVTREVPCAANSAGVLSYACGSSCGRILSCGAHVCKQSCHPPPCEPCALLPSLVKLCPCGQTEIKEGQRKLCTDPMLLCGNLCAKRLECGPSGDNHFCKVECHEGPCPTCPDKTVLPCQCGHTNREVLCSDLPNELNNIFCHKKCNKKLSCGRHRCRSLCCIDSAHRCRLQCGRQLSCSLHRCDNTCHTGHCSPCPQISFSELTCECGTEVILPPIRCGTRPPLCQNPCQRQRACGHPPHHMCHSGDCPPCVVLTSKKCHGQHEERKTIPCSQEEFSCGLPCGKPLSCGKHTCIKICHKGPCNSEKCTQPCNEKREWCGHPCGVPCHSAAPAQCPTPTPCRRAVTATCPCRRRTQQRACADNQRELNKLMSALAASKIQDGESVDLADMSRAGNNLKTLECDDECRVEARTRQMALALQIKNPDVSSKLAPRYSDHVRQWATRDQTFAQHVHEKLTDLVHLAKKSKQKTRSHSFPSMNWQKRQFIHELCEHFGCESVAYDAEPNRNVVATADKEKSWLPAMSVLEVLGRESGKRRVPGPMLRNNVTPHATQSSTIMQQTPSTAKSTGSWATLTSTNAWTARSKATTAPPETKPPTIDYFDYPPDS